MRSDNWAKMTLYFKFTHPLSPSKLDFIILQNKLSPSFYSAWIITTPGTQYTLITGRNNHLTHWHTDGYHDLLSWLVIYNYTYDPGWEFHKMRKQTFLQNILSLKCFGKRKYNVKLLLRMFVFLKANYETLPNSSHFTKKTGCQTH